MKMLEKNGWLLKKATIDVFIQKWVGGLKSFFMDWIQQ